MRFIQIISGWINRHFSNEEAIYLLVFVFVVAGLVFWLGGALAPVLTGLVIAFLLQGLVKRLQNLGAPEWLAIYTCFIVFVSVVVAAILFLFPLIWRQLRNLIEAAPSILDRVRDMLLDLSVRFPDFVTAQQMNNWIEMAGAQIGDISATLLESLFTQLPSLVGLLIYLVLVPISVFFFLKDREMLMGWFLSLLPENRPLLNRVGEEMNVQLANYVRGKFIEILIVGAVTFVSFTILGLNYAALLGVVVGLSVLVPFVGAAVATIPVALVAIIQFGWSVDLALVMFVYAVIQAIDGNVLVPLLFSEAVDLHPITIIIAVLFFGGIWGVWGVFFAIPLATLVKAIYNAWPRQLAEQVSQ